MVLILQVEFASPVGYVEPERQEKKAEKKEEEVSNESIHQSVSQSVSEGQSILSISICNHMRPSTIKD